MNEVLTPEVMPELAAVAKREGVANQTGAQLVATYAPMHAAIIAARETAQKITNGENPTERKMARECRLSLRRARCEVEDARKAAKAEALRYGKAVDGMANVLKFLCEPEEERLLAIEEHEERKEAARIAALVAARTSELLAVGADPAAYNLCAMTDATWQTVITAARKAKQDAEAAARKAEADRIAKEQAEREERARIQAENERLRKEAMERDAELKRQREEAEAKQREIEAAARKERDAALKRQRELEEIAERERKEREIIEAKRAAERAAEEKRKRDQDAAARKAARAPDREKINAFAASMMAVEPPAMATEDGRVVMAEILAARERMANWMRGKAVEL